MTETVDVEKSEIQKFYSGSSIFLTGATGFLGKLILEKLLRTCSDLNTIYCLVRPKKGKNIDTRFEDIFEDVVFERLKVENPNFKTQVQLISGDCSLPNVGISDVDKQKIIDNVQVVFHCAATVRFVEKLRLASNTNVRATRDIVLMCKEIQNLKALIHVSTAFSNCPRKQINEEFYDDCVSGQALLAAIEALNDKSLDSMTPSLLGDWPNTYAFTKAVAENVIKVEGKGLPVAVVRPSIVISTVKEPEPGWIDNFYGPTGIVVGAAMGLLRTMHAHPEKNADIVPADYVINNCLAAAWDIHANRDSSEYKDKIPIYNYVNSSQNPISWKTYMELAEENCKQFPSPIVIWHYWFKVNRSKYMHFLYTIFLHFLPALIVDNVAKCIGKKPMLWKAYSKIHKFSHVISYFSTDQWEFQNYNVQNLWKKLSAKDKELFAFDICAVKWKDFFWHYARGGRIFLMKDPIETMDAGRVKLRYLMIAHYTLVTVLSLLLLKLMLFLFNCIF